MLCVCRAPQTRHMPSLALALAAACAVTCAAANLVAFDVGGDSMKIAVVKPGSPPHIVANPQSKRKVGSRRRGGEAILRRAGHDALVPSPLRPPLPDPRRHHLS